MLGIDEAQLRVVAEDVGGNFGTRNGTYPELGWPPGRRGVSGGRSNIYASVARR
jgi:hypothetical protein